MKVTSVPPHASSGNKKRAYLIVGQEGPNEQQASIVFSTDMRDALLREYQENGTRASSGEFSNLSEVQDVLERMRILEPATTGYFKKAFLSHEEIYGASNLAEENELLIAQERLYQAHYNFLQAKRYLTTVEQQCGMMSMNAASLAAAPFKKPSPKQDTQDRSNIGLTTEVTAESCNAHVSETLKMSTMKTINNPSANSEMIPFKCEPLSSSASPHTCVLHSSSIKQANVLHSSSINQAKLQQQQYSPTFLFDIALLSSSQSAANIAKKLQYERIINNSSTTVTDNKSDLIPTAIEKQSADTSKKAIESNSNRWRAMYEKLNAYKSANGNCLVPRSFAKNPRLASWVAEQRKQYRLRKLGKPSNMSDERVRLLNHLGFTWQAQCAAWNRHFNNLCSYKEENGTCLVPLNDDKYPQLGLWVKEQRRHRSLMVRGKHSHMTQERVDILNSIGFCWDSHEASWWDKFKELQKYKEEFGHCMVPQQYSPNPQLHKWVYQQRRQLRWLKEGKMSRMNGKRARALEELGFVYTSACQKNEKTDTLAKFNDQEDMKDENGQSKTLEQQFLPHNEGIRKEAGGDSEVEGEGSDVENEGEMIGDDNVDSCDWNNLLWSLKTGESAYGRCA